MGLRGPVGVTCGPGFEALTVTHGATVSFALIQDMLFSGVAR